MVLNLKDCYRCYKKVDKKVLSKFPEIRDHKYEEKANTVIITVVCGSPEKIKDKIFRKGGESIKSIEIKPPKEAEKKVEKPADDKPKEPDEKPKEPEKPKTPEPAADPLPLMAYPPIGTDYYYGHGGGPCYFGGPPQYSRPCYETYGKPVYDNSWGNDGYRYNFNSVGNYFSDENTQGCSIM